MPIQPYLFFEGRCDDAIAFYRTALGAEVTALMRHGENPDGMQGPPGTEDKVMHAEIRIGDATILASDGFCAAAARFQGFGLALNVPDTATAERHFGALAEGGEVRMPLGRSFFSPCFGMVADRFGVLWMVVAAPA
jgi:PhnB protein